MFQTRSDQSSRDCGKYASHTNGNSPILVNFQPCVVLNIIEEIVRSLAELFDTPGKKADLLGAWRDFDLDVCPQSRFSEARS